MSDEHPRTFGDDARDVRRSFVIAFSLMRWGGLHDKYLRFRWLVIIAGFAAFMDGMTAFPPHSTEHVMEAALGLWALGMAALWNPSGQPWWRDPDGRYDGYVDGPIAVPALAAMAKRAADASERAFSVGIEVPVTEFDAPPEQPMRLLADWIASAEQHRVAEPLALTLATTGADGTPSTRVVLVRDVDLIGLVFSSHHGSRKGRELEQQPRAAGSLYWRETRQQVNLAGRVERLPEAESDALFAERPRAAQATTLASHQSEPLDDEPALARAARAATNGSEPLERPADWGGYRLVVDRIEFWHGSPDRLHRRLEYTLADGGWTWRRLQP
ncbi:MAG: pyridoxal 5'-phosphate synthase [Solirubrobacteraceae bacterium]|nr:pyridoxal 5'-phosphate synthase [Solirubrobacteraceae bacterium]